MIMGKKSCPKCGGEMTGEFCLVLFNGTWGRRGNIIEKSSPIGIFCKNCGHFEFAGEKRKSKKSYRISIRRNLVLL